MNRALNICALVCALVIAAAGQTAQFPASVATNTHLKITKNGIKTSLRASARSAETVITVADCSRIEAGMLLTIARAEIVNVTAVGAGCRLTVTRGFDDTTAVNHSAMAEVASSQTAWERNTLKTEIQAIENALGPNLSNVTSTAVSAPSYSWDQTPGGSLIAGANVVTLTPCPRGVAGTNTVHTLRITGGTGGTEYVTITGGTCTSEAPSGTVIFTAAGAHSGAWTIGSGTAGIREAVATLAPTGGAITVPAGSYTGCSIDTAGVPVIISGAGLGSTTLSCDVATRAVITISSSTSALRDLTVQHSVSPTSGGDGVFVSGDNPTIERVRSTKNYHNFSLGQVSTGLLKDSFATRGNGDGVHFRASGSLYIFQWDVHDTFSQLNAGHGFNLTVTSGLQTIGPRFHRAMTYANGGNGIRISYNSDSDVAISNVIIEGSYLGSDNGSGIFMDSNGTQNSIHDTTIELSGYNADAVGYAGTVVGESAAAYCIEITANNDPLLIAPLVISGVSLHGCAWSGIYAGASATISGGQITTNGYAQHASDYRRAGITVRAARVAVSNMFFGSAGGSYQLYGVETSGTISGNVSLSQLYADGSVQLVKYNTAPTTITSGNPQLKSQRFGSSCTTGSSAGDSCTTEYSLTAAFPSALFTASCTPVAASGAPIVTISSATASTITLKVTAGTAVAAQAQFVHCTFIHD